MLNIKVYASSSDGNMYLLQNEDTNILLECGIKKEKIIKSLVADGLLITDLNACLITHQHSDHALNVKYISSYINTYSTYSLAETNKDVKPLKALKPIKIGSIKILPIPVSHGKVENNAFVFMDQDSCVFFGTDFSLMEFNLKNFKFDKIYIELNYDETLIEEALKNQNEERKMKYIRQISTHMSKAGCMLHLKKMDLSKCKEIVLLHASVFLLNKNNILKDFEEEFKNIKISFGKEK